MATSTSDRNLQKFLTWRIFRSSSSFSSEGCSICLAPYDANHKAVRVRFKGCPHRFGRECLETWLFSDNSNSNCCPVCRKEWYTRRTPAPPFSLLHCIRSLRLRLGHKLLARQVEYRLAQQQVEYMNIPQTEGVELEGDYLTAIDSRLTVLEETGREGYELPPDAHDRLESLEVRLGALRQNIVERSRERASTIERRTAEFLRQEMLQNFEELENVLAARRRGNQSDHVAAEEDNDDVVEELLDYYATIGEEGEEGVDEADRSSKRDPSPYPARRGPVRSNTAPSDLESTDARPLEASPTRVSHISSSSLVSSSLYASSTSLEILSNTLSDSSISTSDDTLSFHSASEQVDVDVL